MTEQDRTQILYLLTLRDIDHAKRPVVQAIRYLVPLLMVIVVMAVLTTLLGLPAKDATALMVATVPASVFAYVGWDNAREDRVEALEYRAAEIRLDLGEQPVGAMSYESATAVEKAIAAAADKLNPLALPEGVGSELDLDFADERDAR